MTGDEARVLRLGMHLSARAVAIELGTNESSVYRWEKRGDRQVPRMFARALRDLVRERAQQSDGDSDGDGLRRPRKANGA